MLRRFFLVILQSLPWLFVARTKCATACSRPFFHRFFLVPISTSDISFPQKKTADAPSFLRGEEYSHFQRKSDLPDEEGQRTPSGGPATGLARYSGNRIPRDGTGTALTTRKAGDSGSCGRTCTSKVSPNEQCGDLETEPELRKSRTERATPQGSRPFALCPRCL